MGILKNFLAALALCSVAFAASASPANPANGAEYITLAAPQPVEAGKKIEVIEFFAYWCPHCNSFEPQLAAWVKKQGDNIVFKRVHVPYNEATLPQQRAYSTLEALGLLDKLHAKFFDAIHVERSRMNTDDMVFDWAAKNGIDRKKFSDTYNSMGVQAKVRRADAMMKDYKIEYWPLITIDGRYQTSPHQANPGAAQQLPEAQQQAAALQVMDFLVAKAKAEKK